MHLFLRFGILMFYSVGLGLRLQGSYAGFMTVLRVQGIGFLIYDPSKMS